MYKVVILGLSTLLTTSLVAHAAPMANSHKEWAPKSMAVKVVNAQNKQVEKLLALQKIKKNKKRYMDIDTDTTVFLADFVTSGTGTVGEKIAIDSFVGAYIVNNSSDAKNYLVETTACTDFFLSDNCANIADIYSVDANSELPLSQKITIEYKFDETGAHAPTTITQITELASPTLELKGTFSASSIGFGELDIQ